GVAVAGGLPRRPGGHGGDRGAGGWRQFHGVSGQRTTRFGQKPPRVQAPQAVYGRPIGTWATPRGDSMNRKTRLDFLALATCVVGLFAAAPAGAIPDGARDTVH